MSSKDSLGSCCLGQLTHLFSFLFFSPTKLTETHRKDNQDGPYTFIYLNRSGESSDSHRSQILCLASPLCPKQKALYPNLPPEVTDQVTFESIFFQGESAGLLWSLRQQLTKGGIGILERCQVVYSLRVLRPAHSFLLWGSPRLPVSWGLISGDFSGISRNIVGYLPEKTT